MRENKSTTSSGHWSTSPQLPEEIISAWSKPGGAISPVAIVASIDPDGSPRVAPFGSLCAITAKTLRFCSHNAHNTYANLRRDSRVCVALISRNAAVSVSGLARVIREQMETDSQFALLEIEIEQVKNDMVYRIELEEGISIHPKEEVKNWYDDVMNEVRNLAGESQESGLPND